MWHKLTGATHIHCIVSFIHVYIMYMYSAKWQKMLIEMQYIDSISPWIFTVRVKMKDNSSNIHVGGDGHYTFCNTSIITAIIVRLQKKTYICHPFNRRKELEYYIKYPVRGKTCSESTWEATSATNTSRLSCSQRRCRVAARKSTGFGKHALCGCTCMPIREQPFSGLTSCHHHYKGRSACDTKLAVSTATCDISMTPPTPPTPPNPPASTPQPMKPPTMTTTQTTMTICHCL